MKRRLIGTFLVMLAVATLHAHLPASAAPAAPTYAGQIQPLFQRHCMPCHSSTTRTAGLNLQTYAALIQGGKGGAVVIPGRSGESRLVALVEGRLTPRMPPAGPGLSAAEIATLKAWIDGGAPAGTPGHAAQVKTERLPKLPVIRPVHPVTGALVSAAFSPDGRFLALGGYREVRLVDLGRAAQPQRPGSGSRSHAAAKAAGPSTLNPQPSTSSRLPRAAGPVTGVAFSPDGRLLAAAGGAPGQFGEIQLWNLREPHRMRTLRGHRDALYGVAFSPDGKMLAAAGYDRLVSLWSLSGGPPRMLKDHIDAVYGIAFSPDGRQVASASGDRTIKVWEVATGRRLYTLSEPAAEQYGVAFSLDGKQLVAGGADKILRLWNITVTGGTLARSAFAHEGAILRLLFSPDGRSLVTSGEDRRVKIWDATTLTERRVLERQPDWAAALAVSPDARHLAVGRYDGSLAIYDAATGHRLLEPLGSPAAVTAMARHRLP